jgi:hypothetical protein
MGGVIPQFPLYLVNFLNAYYLPITTEIARRKVMSKFGKSTTRTMIWRLALPLALLASGFTPVAVHAKVSEVRPASSAIAVSDTKIEGSKFNISPQQYVAHRVNYRYRPYCYNYNGYYYQPRKFYTYRYLYNPYTGRYEYRLVYFWR